MDIPSRAPSHAPLNERLKMAGFGFGMTVVPVLVLGSIHFLLAPSIAKAGFNLADHSWLIAQYEAMVLEFYAWVVVIVFGHWLLAGILGGGRFLEIKSANVALAFSGLTFALALAVASIVKTPVTIFEGVCQLLQIPDGMPTLPPSMFSFDGQTPCEEFAGRAVLILLPGLPSILLVTSAILRIARFGEHYDL